MSSLRPFTKLLFSGIASRKCVVALSERGLNSSSVFSVARRNPSVYSFQKKNLHASAKCLDTFHIQDEDDFNARVLKSKKPVVVQFHATWCGPCKMLSPRMEKCIAATKEAIDLAQVDIDDNPDIAMSYSVGAVPAVLAIKDGKVVDKFVGLKDEDQVDSFVAKLLK